MNRSKKVANTESDATVLEQRDELARKLDKANRDNLLLMQVIQKADLANSKPTKESGRDSKDANSLSQTETVKNGPSASGAKLNKTTLA